VEYAFNNDDGTLAPPIQFIAPRTNLFIVTPHLVAMTASPDGATIRFAASAQNGTAWAMIIQASHSLLIDVPALKAGTYSVGGPGCRRHGDQIGDATTTYVFSDCSLRRGMTYIVFVYIEGVNATYSDGTLSSGINISVPSSSLLFSTDLRLLRTPSTSQVFVSFKAESADLGPDAHVNGSLWAMIVPDMGASHVTVPGIKLPLVPWGRIFVRSRVQTLILFKLKLWT